MYTYHVYMYQKGGQNVHVSSADVSKRWAEWEGVVRTGAQWLMMDPAASVFVHRRASRGGMKATLCVLHNANTNTQR